MALRTKLMRGLENRKRKKYAVAAIAGLAGLSLVSVGLWIALRGDDDEAEHFQRNEILFVIARSAPNMDMVLFRAGRDLAAAVRVVSFDGSSAWLQAGSYFLAVRQQSGTFYYPVPVLGYRAGPGKDGSLAVTIHPIALDVPPRVLPASAEFKYIPSGYFLLGNRLNPQELHYVWLPGFYMASFETTNAEFLEFFHDNSGYRDESNWAPGGREWKNGNASRATALLETNDPDYRRFGLPDQPVVGVNWYEANAYCHWLTRKFGGTGWMFSLPSEAEWEKAARGPDSFDYGLGNFLSDPEILLYNWKKNPTAEVTVVGVSDSRGRYLPNRFGLYHMTGNVSEWTQSVFRAYNRRHPFEDDDRNHDAASGLRVVRGGSWYSASVASLSIAYRETFQPEVSTPYLGFRVVARHP